MDKGRSDVGDVGMQSSLQDVRVMGRRGLDFLDFQVFRTWGCTSSC
jgi:hypothetical protein